MSDEDRIAQKIESDVDAAIEEYRNLPDSKGGKILNTDVGRELSDDYRASNEARATLNHAVHEPVSSLVKEMYAQRLAEPLGPGEEPLVFFTGGIVGAGKSSGIEKLPGIVERAHIVYDTNLTGFESSVKKIRQAREAKHDVQILYTHSEPLPGFRRYLRRASKHGRTVAIPEQVRIITEAPDTIPRLYDEFRDDPGVKWKFLFIDNAGDTPQEALETTIDASGDS